ncbi:bel2 [Squirrel monkey simian foamy virus]|uniref:Bel2 n=1 Tax=Squirrel monkey simian foamy virus TaxID=2170201 RepID=D5JWU9_9RETR|nr:bel2 [Squirrel monkey simian foamy virus]ADE05998.1 bel2 [Squirrel monkey simian foamy virus]
MHHAAISTITPIITVNDLTFASQEEIQACGGVQGKGDYYEIPVKSLYIPVLSPTPLSGHSLRQVICTLWRLYQSYYNQNCKPVPPLRWRERRRGNWQSETLPIPPLGCVTWLAWEDTTVIIICGGDDGFKITEEGQCCSSTTCAMIVYPCKITSNQLCNPFIRSLRCRHPFSFECIPLRHENSLRDLYKPPVYEERGKDVKWEYRKDVVEYYSGNALTPDVIRWKSTKFQKVLHVIEKLSFTEGRLPMSYARAKEEWGSPKGRSGERVLWTKKYKKDYYDPDFPFDELDEEQEWETESWFSMIPRLTKSSTGETIQSWLSQAVPAGFKLTRPNGDKYVSKRSVFHPLDIEKKDRWNPRAYDWCMCNESDPSGEDSDEYQ